MRAKTQAIYGALLALALLAPFLYMAGIASRGVALFSANYVRLAVTYAALGLSSAAAAFLAFRRGSIPLRIVGGAALIATVGVTLWAAGLWRRDIRDILIEIRMLPVEPGRIGVLVAPANHSPEAVTEAREIQAAIRDTLDAAGLGEFSTVRYTYPLSSEEFARHTANEMHAQVVVWKTETGHDVVRSTHHVTVLGANETDISLEPQSLMLLLATQDTVTISSRHPRGEQDPLSAGVVAPTAAGFAVLAAGRPRVAASQFQGALNFSGVPSDTLPSLHNHLGTALLYLDRPDLAIQEYQLSDALDTNAQAWVGLGNAQILRRDWDGAARAYEEALVRDAYYVDAYCGLGIVHATHRSVGRAQSAFLQAIDLDGTRGVPYALLGLARELEADIEGARIAYETCALNAGPNAGLYNAATERADQVVRYPPTAVPTATPVPIPTPTKVPTSQMYRVETGDTLQAIAIKLDVTVDSIVELNELPDPNSIRLGQVLLIPRRR